MALKPLDPPMTSKKYLALLMAFVGWTALIALGILVNVNPTPLTAMVCTLGFVQVSYIFGQSFVDRYTQLPLSAVQSLSPLGSGSSLASGLGDAFKGIAEAWTGDADVSSEETSAIFTE